AKWLFLAIIFFGISLAMGVFVFVIAKLFGLYLKAPDPANGIKAVEGYPQAVLPSILLMIIAASCGLLLKHKKLSFTPLMSVGFAVSLVGIWLGLWLKNQGYYGAWWPTSTTWIYILLAYAFLASVLPVWSLLQPRDFLNSLLLYLGLGMTYLGLFVSNPSFDAPPFVPEPVGAPPMLPFVFILIACGAASGFHGLVSSGTTSKQLDTETDARIIGYGGMIGESLLGLLAVFACTAGFASSEQWHTHYASFHAAAGLPQKLAGFIEGSTSFLVGLGLPAGISSAVIAMVVVSFALTTLDSATRLLRFNFEELFGRFSLFRNRYISSLCAVCTIAFFAFFEVDGKPAALALWALFGTTNQLLAGLTLILATLYLKHRGKPTLYTGLPAIFMLTSTGISMTTNLIRFLTGEHPNYLLGGVGIVLLILGAWLVVESIVVLLKPKQETQLEITF
ncbi:MAG: carbon starvation protein A, partial [Bradymonadia bacterium]